MGMLINRIQDKKCWYCNQKWTTNANHDQVYDITAEFIWQQCKFNRIVEERKVHLSILNCLPNDEQNIHGILTDENKNENCLQCMYPWTNTHWAHFRSDTEDIQIKKHQKLNLKSLINTWITLCSWNDWSIKWHTKHDKERRSQKDFCRW